MDLNEGTVKREWWLIGPAFIVNVVAMLLASLEPLRETGNGTWVHCHAGLAVIACLFNILGSQIGMW